MIAGVSLITGFDDQRHERAPDQRCSKSGIVHDVAMNVSKPSRRPGRRAGLPPAALSREGETRPASPLPENSPTQDTAPLRTRAGRAVRVGLPTLASLIIAGAVEQFGADGFEFLVHWLEKLF